VIELKTTASASRLKRLSFRWSQSAHQNDRLTDNVTDCQ
jgi:hypothetical protein